MANDNEQRKAAFMRDLDEITRRHGVYVWGCACCGSPALQSLDGDAQLGVPPALPGGYAELGTHYEDIKWVAGGRWQK